MRFFKNDILVSESSPPEEILPSVTGGCGFWQIVVCVIAFHAVFIYGIDVTAIKTSMPFYPNYTCKDSNGSQCFYANGSKCEAFEFPNKKVVTFIEKLLLVCEKEGWIIWIKISYRIGLMLGYCLCGGCGDKLGVKVTAMIFISLQILTGLLITSMKKPEVLLFFILMHAVFCTSLSILPAVAVCDAVGNKWRTTALGATNLAVPLSILIFPCFYKIFSEITGIMAAVSVLPLLLLFPLLYFKNSPNNVALMLDFTKAEEVIRKISKCNKSPMSSDARLRPVQVIVDKHVPHTSKFYYIWKSKTTSAMFGSLLWIWFCLGFSESFLINYAYSDMSLVVFYGLFGVIGYSVAFILCHFVQHRIIIGLFAVFKTLTLGLCLWFDFYVHNKEYSFFRMMLFMSTSWFWAEKGTLENLTPRILPTEMRCLCYGKCKSFYHFGCLFGILMSHLNINNGFWIIGSVFVTGCIFELFSTYWIWNVHNRELPDYLIDCRRFQMFYKPTRFITIYEKGTNQELEVKVMELSPMEVPVKN